MGGNGDCMDVGRRPSAAALRAIAGTTCLARRQVLQSTLDVCDAEWNLWRGWQRLWHVIRVMEELSIELLELLDGFFRS